jgi:hypothetical protein
VAALGEWELGFTYEVRRPGHNVAINIRFRRIIRRAPPPAAGKPRAQRFRDVDSNKFLGFEAFAKKADQVARDLARSDKRRMETGRAQFDARTLRQERARGKAHQRALDQYRHQQARMARVNAQLTTPQEAVTLSYQPMTLDEARAAVREFRRTGSMPDGVAITGVDWVRPNKAPKSGDSSDAQNFHAIIASAPLSQMRLGRPSEDRIGSTEFSE